MTESVGQVRALALHACCGPCLIEPQAALSEQFESVTVVFVNPNIHPLEEYERRRDTLAAYACDNGIEVVELNHRPEEWFDAVRDARTRQERCRACYGLRLGATARWAAANGRDAFATTLTVSPYQDAAGIAQAGEAAATESGVAYVDSDFRDRFAAATTRSRELGMYRQNYCGCLMSEIEARVEREVRKKARRNGGARADR